MINTNLNQAMISQSDETRSSDRSVTQSSTYKSSGSVSFSQLLQQRERGQDIAGASLKASQDQQAQRSQADKRHRETEATNARGPTGFSNSSGLGANGVSRPTSNNASGPALDTESDAPAAQEMVAGQGLSSKIPSSRATRASSSSGLTVANGDDTEKEEAAAGTQLTRDGARSNRAISTALGNSRGNLSDTGLPSKLNQSAGAAIHKIDARVSDGHQDEEGAEASVVATLTSTAITPRDGNLAHGQGGDAYTSATKDVEPYVMQSRLDAGGWHAEMGQRLVWMSQGEHQTATLTLNPPHLGPLKIEIQVHRNIVSASFMSDNAEVRQALAEGFPALKSAMANAGVTLGQAAVSSGEQASQDAQPAPAARLMAKRFLADSSPVQTGLDIDQRRGTSGHGLVDTFA